MREYGVFAYKPQRHFSLLFHEQVVVFRHGDPTEGHLLRSFVPPVHTERRQVQGTETVVPQVPGVVAHPGSQSREVIERDINADASPRGELVAAR